VRRAIAVYLFAVLAGLPAVDFVYCPDGCAEAGASQHALQGGASADHDGCCGFCLNGIAVSQAALHLLPARRLRIVAPFVAPPFLSSAPPALERPPRLA
jgi:hypothetical protein